jgi:hypothetical protein
VLICLRGKNGNPASGGDPVAAHRDDITTTVWTWQSKVTTIYLSVGLNGPVSFLCWMEGAPTKCQANVCHGGRRLGIPI